MGGGGGYALRVPSLNLPADGEYGNLNHLSSARGWTEFASLDKLDDSWSDGRSPHFPVMVGVESVWVGGTNGS